jgi:cell division protein FtsW
MNIRERASRAWKTVFYHGTHEYYDYTLIFVVLFLMCFGLIMVYSTTGYSDELTHLDAMYSLKRQAIIAACAIVFMFIISKMDYHFLLKLSPAMAVIIFLVCVAVLAMGESSNGSTRWLGLGGNTIQPSEFAKPILIMTLSYYLTKKFISKKRTSVGREFFYALGAGGITVALMVPVIAENLSTGIIIAGIGFFMTYITSRYKYVFQIILVSAVLLVVVAWNSGFLSEHVMKEYQVERVEAWLDPEASTDDSGYQILQGLYAVGSGGLFGKGLGNSIQKLGFLPEAQNDMVFAIICEELGLFGAFLIMVLYGFLLFRMMSLANRAPDMSGSLLISGVMVHIGLQVVMNIAVVTNSMPNTGVTLPFISYGGSALLCLFSEIGLVLSVTNQITD